GLQRVQRNGERRLAPLVHNVKGKYLTKGKKSPCHMHPDGARGCYQAVPGGTFSSSSPVRASSQLPASRAAPLRGEWRIMYCMRACAVLRSAALAAACARRNSALALSLRRGLRRGPICV